MNRIFKTLALFLLVSTVSFVYAQDELDKSDGGKEKLFFTPDKTPDGKVPTAKTADDKTSKGSPSITAPGGPPAGDDMLLEASGEAEKPGAKLTLWERIFGKKAGKPAKKPD